LLLTEAVEVAGATMVFGSISGNVCLAASRIRALSLFWQAVKANAKIKKMKIGNDLVVIVLLFCKNKKTGEDMNGIR
jgi:hypothetical protein